MTNNSVRICSGDQTALSPGTNPTTYSRRFKFCPETLLLYAFSAATVRAGRDFLPAPFLSDTLQGAFRERNRLISAKTAHRCCTASILPLANQICLARPCSNAHLSCTAFSTARLCARHVEIRDAVFAGCNSRPDSGVSSSALDRASQVKLTHTHTHTHKLV